MHRSFAWGVIAILTVMLALFAGVPGAPAAVVRAEAAAPAVPPPDDEIVVITSAGQLLVDDPYAAPGFSKVSWNSGADTGFTTVAGGDFNGDGDAELVAARGSFIQVFDPVEQPGRSRVVFSVNLGSGRNVRLLTTGDFDADGRDEFAVMNYISGTGVQAALAVYDGGTNGTQGEWTRRNYIEYGAIFQDMSVGDFNADGADDLVMVRNSGNQRLVHAWNVRTWSLLAEGTYSRPWYAVAGGKLSLSTPGDQMALTRDGANAATESLILFKAVGSTFDDLVANSAWRWNPEFTSLSNGDLNGDGDDEVVMLRDPINPTTSLIMVNPAGAAMNSFEQAAGSGSAAFRIVRTGDTDADGHDEIVILRNDRYRVYTEPNVDSRATETSGSFYASGSVSNLPFMALANVDGGGKSGVPTLGVSPTTLSFNLEYRQTSPTQNVSITNLGSSDVLNWQAEVTSGSSWLVLNQTSGTTPGTLGVSVDTSVIAPGTYTGKIRVSATGGSGTIQGTPQEITVNVTITGVTMVVSPTLLDFEIGYGDVVSKPVTVSSQGGSAPFAWRAIVQGGGDWLVVSPMQGISPTTVTVSINSRVNPPGGPFLGSIMFVADDANIANPIQYVTVRLVVKDAGLVVTPANVMIKHQPGTPGSTAQVLIERPGIATPWTATALPAAQVDIARAKLAAGEYKVTEAGIVFDGLEPAAVDWLTVTPTSGTTPTTMTLTVQGSAIGMHNATIFVNSSAGTREIHVTGWIANKFYNSYMPLVLR